MHTHQRALNRAKRDTSDCTWYLWEDDCPPPTHGFFSVMMPNGEELAALFDRKGVWWSLRMQKIIPTFWRDSSHLHR